MKRLLLVLLLARVAQAGSPWSTSVGAGLAITGGNTESRNLNFSLNTLRDAKKGQVFRAEALLLRGEQGGKRQVDRTTASARYERLFEDRVFWFGEVGYLRDPFRDDAQLVAPVAGAGYHILRDKTRKLTFDGAVGAAIQNSSSTAVKGGQSFDWAISPTSRFTQRLTGLWKADDPDDALYHFDAAVATKVATRVELKVSWVYDYKNRPSSRNVEKGDTSLFAALLFKF